MKRIIFFDWDGTLASTKLSEQANVKRTKLFCEGVGEKEIIKLQHNNNNDHYGFVQSLIKKETGLDNKNDIKTMQAIFFSFFYLKEVKNLRENSLLFDIEKFKKFKEINNLKFVIATSLWQATIEGVLNILGIKYLFDGVYGCPSDLSTSKQDNLKFAIENEKGIPKIMIGDRGEDIDAGKICGLKTIFCNYGHGDVSNADINIDHGEKLFYAMGELLDGGK